MTHLEPDSHIFNMIATVTVIRCMYVHTYVATYICSSTGIGSTVQIFEEGEKFERRQM
jgi:hypothetical protein